VVAARVGRVGHVATAGQLHPVGLLLGRVVDSGGIKHGKASGAHVVRRQLHGGGEVVVVQQSSRRQAAQCCSRIKRKSRKGISYSPNYQPGGRDYSQGGGRSPEP